MSKEKNRAKPLVYSCSGCSSAAQMANYLAVKMDREGLAEMSCIAGVGGNVKKLVRTAMSGRKIIAIDGCPLACSKACLGNHNIIPDMHIELTRLGVRKRQHENFDIAEANQIMKEIELQFRKNGHLEICLNLPGSVPYVEKPMEVFSSSDITHSLKHEGQLLTSIFEQKERTGQ